MKFSSFLPLTVILLLSCIHHSSGISCYVCEGSDQHENDCFDPYAKPDKHLTNCTEIPGSTAYDQCYKEKFVGKNVSHSLMKRECSNKSDKCNTYEKTDSGELWISCCESDGCNAGVAVGVSMLTVAISSLTVICYMKTSF